MAYTEEGITDVYFDNGGKVEIHGESYLTITDDNKALHADPRHRPDEELTSDVHLGTQDELIRFLIAMQKQLHKHESEKKSLRSASWVDTQNKSISEINDHIRRINILRYYLQTSFDPKDYSSKSEIKTEIDKHLVHIANYCMFAWTKNNYD